MRKDGNAQVKPYHHGDLSRALVEAGRRILEAEGPEALSLRAVAREAGVSPAAPYHHFKDKRELLEAVAQQGWTALEVAIRESKAKGKEPRKAIVEVGLAYVLFAQRNPKLYRLMYDLARSRTDMPQAKGGAGAYHQVQCALIDAGEDLAEPFNLQLSTIACWAAGHGLAELAGFKQFDHIKAAMGGEEAFLRGVLEHIQVYGRQLTPAT
ncbi:MAG: TetR/AcrR family transcriptional regulator [Caulobacteraceae bacterium]|nr:TetR/AcrR family transcriptional regulator [Caulobacteraceae bacterium]